MILLFAIMTIPFTAILCEGRYKPKEYGSDNTSDNISYQQGNRERIEVPDDIHSIDDMNQISNNNSLFFIDNSCNGGLNHRHACSVEAAARVHPYRRINILHRPVNNSCFYKKPLKELGSYKNVNRFRLHMKTFLQNTPLYSLWSSGIWSNSYYANHYSADILRYVTLYKYGGVYLDLDTIVAKPLDLLPQPTNWAGREDMDHVGIGLLALSKEGIGGRISQEILSMIQNSIKQKISNLHGVTLLTDALQRICNTTEVNNMTAKQCDGFQVYDMWYFYSMPRQLWRSLFSKQKKNMLEEEFAFHVWNRLAKDEPIYKDSLYAQIMRRHCPKIYKSMCRANKIRMFRPTQEPSNQIRKPVPWILKNISVSDIAKVRVAIKM